MLRQWCEGDFGVVISVFPAFDSPGLGSDCYSGVLSPTPPGLPVSTVPPGWPLAGRRFVTLEGGRPKPEGGRIQYYGLASEAIAAFREGWRQYRAENPGFVLYWRHAPHLWTHDGRYAVVARVLMGDPSCE